MEFTQDELTELGLTEENAPKVSAYLADKIAVTKKEYDGLANENAEGILNGVLKSAKDKLGVSIDREQGEKYADYLLRVSDSYFGSTKSQLASKQKEIDDKLKNFKGDNESKLKLQQLEDEKDSLLQKVADYDSVKEKAEKFEPLQSEYSKMKLEVAFNGVKPIFPKEANIYEVNAKWGEFKSGILNDYEIELVEGTAMAISKENKHKQVKLADLVGKDETLSKLVLGRQQSGVNAREINSVEIDGVPFKVPENADSAVRTQVIKDYLLNVKKLNPTSSEYSKQFSDLNKKIVSQK